MTLLRPLLFLFMLLATSAVLAFDTHEPFEDPELESRYHRMINELRCLVCQNESIAESDAELAQDLRARTREMLAEGKSDREIKQFMTDRYGDFVLYRPPMRADTLGLWFGPGLLLLVGGIILVVTLRKRSRQEAEEEAGLEDQE